MCVCACASNQSHGLLVLSTSFFVGCQRQVVIPSGVREVCERLAHFQGGVCVSVSVCVYYCVCGLMLLVGGGVISVRSTPLFSVDVIKLH